MCFAFVRTHWRATQLGYLSEYVVHSDVQGVLVYFSSKKMMLVVYEALTAAEKERVLMQGPWQTWAMVEEHKRRIDAGQRAILFGLDSISEGVDLPGHYCSRVIITKLPFPSPADPVIATHAEFLIDPALINLNF